MAITYLRGKSKRSYIFYTIITAILLCAVFANIVNSLYKKAESEAYENLHIQTKQIKDDITLQLISDRENIATMASFASKLYNDGESYDLMFRSFKPIGLIENIGILTPDNTFITKAASVNLEGLISFEEEKQKGTYISGRVTDVKRNEYEIIRSAVPIVSNGETVGILYGVTSLDKIAEKYNQMAKDIDAQLFVYDKATGDLIIDNVHDKLGNISFLKDRKYNDNYSYEQMMSTDKGFTSFMSAYKDENAHLHYSTIEDIGWMIAVVRYDSQVFTSTQELTNVLILGFLVMIAIIILYIIALVTNERQLNAITNCASDVRKTLLETSGGQNNINYVLKNVCEFVHADSAVFFNTDNEEYNHNMDQHNEVILDENQKKYLKSELFNYASEFYVENGALLNVLCIKPNKHLQKTNPELHTFLKVNKIYNILFSATISNSNHVTILAIINTKRENQSRLLAEKTAACFSMALHNKNYLNKTKLVATTDALTGALNRVAYNGDVELFDKGNNLNVACVYVDVNELHIVNNMYGHATGDEMLKYIANTLKEVFYGHNVYRMGGDEFVVLCQNTTLEAVEKNLNVFVERLKPKNYHVAVGLSFRNQNTNVEEMVKEAEEKMYEAKAKYYQNKEQQGGTTITGKEFVQMKTGIVEIDTLLSIIKENYNGIYCVSLNTDRAKRILMPTSFKYNENEDDFSILFSKYVSKAVEPDYHRALMSFLNYDVIKKQLTEGNVPRIAFKKNNGENMILSVYKLPNNDDTVFDTLWIFANA